MTGIVDSVDVSVEVFGGLDTDLAPSDLPHGVSPDCQDVAFLIGSVRTRPGVTALYNLTGNGFVNYLKTFTNLQEIQRLLSLDSLGVLRKDVTPGGVLTPIFSSIIPGSFGKSDSLFAREYIAFGNGTSGLDIPRQYDDTNFDRVSQTGPCISPAAIDQQPSINVSSASQEGTANITQCDEVGNVAQIFIATPLHSTPGCAFTVAGTAGGAYDGTHNQYATTGAPPPETDSIFEFLTNAVGLPTLGAGGTVASSYVTIQTATPHGLLAGQTVIIAGVGAGYNGTWTVYFVPDATHFTFFAATTGLGPLGAGGTIQLGGNISAGLHKVSVIFVTRSGYYTRPAPPNSWTAGGGKAVQLSGIPIGPPNVIARVVCFTAANQSSFYHLGPLGTTLASSNMYIADNTTTSAVFDFTDQLLLLGTLDDPLFNQIELPPVAGTLSYSSRLFHWGEQNNIQNILNLTFDGGFSNLTSATTSNGSPNFPLGWSPDPDPNQRGNGGSANVGGIAPIFGDAYTITGDGASALRGKMSQRVVQDYLNNPIFQTNTAYGVQARLKFAGNQPASGTAHVRLQSTSLGFSTGLDVAPAALTANYQLFKATLTNGIPSIPADLLLQVFVDGTLTNGSIVVIDNIEIYPLNQQYNSSNIRASFGQLNTQGQESYDEITGLIQYNLNDGTGVRSMFKIRERLYIVKEHSFGVTEDTGQTEPSFWIVNDVSTRVGTPSVNGVGIGEDWVVIADRAGLYLYWGGEVLNISQEIRPTWESINWQFGFTISVKVDLRKRRIFIAAPFGNATIPNKVLMMDYHDVGSDAPAIASNPPIHLTYAGTKKAFDRARKWCPWTISANSVAQIELASGQTATYFGSNDGTGNINVLDETGTVFTDNGNTIPSYYVTAAFAELPTEEAKQLKSHRHLYTYLAAYVQGAGTIGVTAFPSSLSNAIALNPQTLANPAFRDLEMMLNQSTERMFVKIASQGNGQNFDLQRMVINMKPEPISIVRGGP